MFYKKELILEMTPVTSKGDILGHMTSKMFFCSNSIGIVLALLLQFAL